ncbi:hypothetical protein ACFFRR_000625 [Megaselia abdita]
MSKLIIFALAAILCIHEIYGITIISKAQWGGKAPKSRTNANKNLGYVVIHHSAGAYCSTMDACKTQMRNMQAYHMNDLGWADIGYNFGIGADGNIYEGRGFGLVGAHATNWNSKALGIMFIGNYNNNKPTAAQVSKAKELIAYGVSQGYLSSNYVLYGHRQVGSTECPGTNLYNEIKKWPKWKA